MATLWAALVKGAPALLVAFLSAIFDAIGKRADKTTADENVADKAVLTAGDETKEVIMEAADARSALRPATDTGALIIELRARAESRAREGGGNGKGDASGGFPQG